MSEYIFVTNIFEYSNIRIYSSHSGLERSNWSKMPPKVEEEKTVYILESFVFVKRGWDGLLPGRLINDMMGHLSASSFFLVLPLPSSLYLTLQAPLSKRTQVRFLLVKFETKIIQDFRLPRYSWMNWSLLSNQVLLQTILISTQSYLILS